MSNRHAKYLCARCSKVVRRIGKHTNFKHPGLAVDAVPVSLHVPGPKVVP